MTRKKTEDIEAEAAREFVSQFGDFLEKPARHQTEALADLITHFDDLVAQSKEEAA